MKNNKIIGVSPLLIVILSLIIGCQGGPEGTVQKEDINTDSWPEKVENALGQLADSVMLDSQIVAFMVDNKFTQSWGYRYLNEPKFKNLIHAHFDSLRYEGLPVDAVLMDFLNRQAKANVEIDYIDENSAILIDVALSHALLACKTWQDWSFFNPTDHVKIYKSKALLKVKSPNYLDSISKLDISGFVKREKVDPEYRRLIEEFKRVYNQARDTFECPNENLKRTLVLGDSSERLQLVKIRLQQLGYGPFAKLDATYTNQLKEQLQKWQSDNGMSDDGKLGYASDELLFLGRTKKLQKLALALDRHRWLRQFRVGSRYVWVNLASARVNLVSTNPQISFSTCSGRRPDDKSDMRTPQLLSIVNYVLAYPYWVAPTSIGSKELFPAVRKDQGYLAKHKYELVKDGVVISDSTVDWKSLNSRNLPFYFRQTPGLHNALGLMKFNIINDMSIYMHDTPSKGAFKNSYRWVSHGCVRLEQPLEMAKFLLSENNEKDIRIPEIVYGKRKRTATDTFSGHQSIRIMLKKPVPVLFDYRCAWFNDEFKKFEYSCDIYSYDEALIAEAKRRGWFFAY